MVAKIMLFNFIYTNLCLIYFQGRQDLRSNQAFFASFVKGTLLLIHVVMAAGRKLCC